MRNRCSATAALAALVCGVPLLAGPAGAALSVGDKAPDFTLQAAVGGKTFSFSLAEALRRGPVVVYFYPKSFTHGCTIEAHEFAEASADFTAAGASLIGISADSIETQLAFSTQECRDKFPIAADPDLSVIRAYDAVRAGGPTASSAVADRISYVIAPDGKVSFAYSDRLPDKHVEGTLALAKSWRAEHGGEAAKR
jgi:peroxiredoxin